MATRAATNHSDRPPRITTETRGAAVESLDLSALSERIVRENGDGIGFEYLVKIRWRSPWSAVARYRFGSHPPSLQTSMAKDAVGLVTYIRYGGKWTTKAAPSYRTPRAPPSHPYSLLAFLYSGLRNSLGRLRRSGDRLPVRPQI